MKLLNVFLAFAPAGFVAANENGLRFGASVSVKFKPRGVTESFNSDRRLFEIRPTNTTFDFKTQVGFRVRPAPSFRTLVFNKTTDTNETFGYRVNVLRLAEVEGTTTALNSTNVVNLYAGGGSWNFQTTQDRVVNGTTIKRMQAKFTANGAVLSQRAEVTLTAEFPQSNVTENGKERRPNALKWSMNINNFQYQSTTSKLAILLTVNSRADRTVNVNSETNAVTSVSIGGTNGTFTWTPTVSIGSTNPTNANLTVTDVGNSTDLTQANDNFKIRGESATYLQVTIEKTDKPQEILWDPENTVDEDQALGTMSSAAGLKVGMLFLVVAAAVATM